MYKHRLDIWSLRWGCRLLFAAFFYGHAIAYTVPTVRVQGGAIYNSLVALMPHWFWVIWFFALASVVAYGLLRPYGSYARLVGIAAVTLGSATLAYMLTVSVMSMLTLNFIPVAIVNYSIMLIAFVWCAATTIWPNRKG